MPVSLTAIEHPEAGRTEVTGLTVFPGLVRFPYAEHSPRDGGRSVGRWLLGALSVLVALALWVRMRQLGYVVGHPHPATTPVLGPLVE